MKRLLSATLSVLIALAFVGCAPAAQPAAPSAEPVSQTPVPVVSETPIPVEPVKANFEPGTYTGVAGGMLGDITVEVTVDEAAITDIHVVSCNDSKYIADAAIADMPTKIIAAQSLAVDTTSGATFCSNGILQATKAALAEAGGDMNALTAPLPESEAVLPDESFDIVVVGAGGAGMAAAMQVGRLSDYSVLVLEQNAMVGGSTTMSGGGISVGGSQINGKDGMPDYTGKELADFLVTHTESLDYLPEGVTVNPVLIERIGDQAGEVFDYFCSEGLSYFPYPITYFDKENGRGIVGAIAQPSAGPVWGEWFRDLAIKNGAEIRTNSRVVELVIQDGAVVGVKVEGSDGNYTVNAKKVILATGGFAYNSKLLVEYNAEWNNMDKIWPCTSGGSTGSIFDLVEPLDTAFTGFGMLCSRCSIMPYSAYTPQGSLLSNYIDCYVNKDGNLFSDPASVSYRRSYDILEQEDAWACAITSAGSALPASANMTMPEYAQLMLESGCGYQADTLDALAEVIGVDAENLKASVAQFNEDVAAGKCQYYGSPVTPIVEEGPYYAFRVTSCILGTLYGVKLNERFQIVSEAGEAIPNLYAAGECAMGNFVVGQYPCGTISLTCAIYGGTLAAEEAMSDIQ